MSSTPPKGFLQVVTLHRMIRSAKSVTCTRIFEERAKHAAEAAERAQQEANAAWHAAERKAAEFRVTQQLARSRREWELNRPDALSLSSPARSLLIRCIHAVPQIACASSAPAGLSRCSSLSYA